MPGTETVILDGLYIEKGSANGSQLSQQTGAGIYNQGKLQCKDVVLRNNTFPALYNAPGSEIITLGTFQIKE